MTIEFNNVCFAYHPEQPILREISFGVSGGDFALIIGHNGAGKSTLLKLLNGILKPTSGIITVAGLDTSRLPTAELARHVAVTFQNPADQLFASTVRKEIEFAPKNLKRPNVGQLVQEALVLCNLERRASQHPYDLPPAERRVLAAAGAIASGSHFLAFDEPSAGLSQIERVTLEKIITTLRGQQRGFLVVSHDLELFLPFATKVLLLREGKMVYVGERERILRDESILRKAGLRLPTATRLNRILEMHS